MRSCTRLSLASRPRKAGLRRREPRRGHRVLLATTCPRERAQPGTSPGGGGDEIGPRLLWGRRSRDGWGSAEMTHVPRVVAGLGTDVAKVEGKRDRQMSHGAEQAESCLLCTLSSIAFMKGETL